MLTIGAAPRALAHEAADRVPALDRLRRRFRNARQTRRMHRWLEEDERAERLYRHWIGPDDLVFDIGAHIGARSKVFARLARSVVAVEPEPEALGLLRATPAAGLMSGSRPAPAAPNRVAPAW